MGAVNHFLQSLLDVKTFVQFYFYYRRISRNSAWKEYPDSGWDRQTMRRCWEVFEKTEKIVCIVFKQLDGDLSRALSLAYIALRALDTIEDDMTLSDAVKQPILRSFHVLTVTPGWKFHRSGPNEKHRQYLVEYDNFIEEINLLSPQYKNIIIDTVLRIGTGMADYAHKNGCIHIETVAEYDQYCHYVGGLTMQAVSEIFSASGKESIALGTQLDLNNSVGLFLQKSDIIHDYKEDVNQKRYFWPRELWGREEYGFKELADMSNTDPESMRNATYVQSAMILDALQHVTDALDYLRMLRNQSVFHLSALIIVRAFANLEFCFMNKEVFQKKVKIRKPQVAELVLRSTSMREVALVFREYSRKIQAKAVRSDPSFSGISIACSKIEQYCEHYCVEKLSTTKTSMSEVLMYVGAAFMLILVFGLSRAEVHHTIFA